MKILLEEEQVYQFVDESNKIENIKRPPTDQEINEFKRFVSLPKITVEELNRFILVYQPNARLRNQYNMNVRVGKYIPPFGSPELEENLSDLLKSDTNAYNMHVAYEKLHPYTDGNGRSGRALWAWRNGCIKGGFLINFYFQSLENS